jgi:hypothetical protein
MTMALVISETLPPAEIKARVVEDVKVKIRQFDQWLRIIDHWINSSSMQLVKEILVNWPPFTRCLLLI